MISLEKWKIVASLQKLPKNVEDLGKLIVAKGFKKLPKAQSGHTGKVGLTFTYVNGKQKREGQECYFKAKFVEL